MFHLGRAMNPSWPWAADTTLTFVISSHVGSELERFCDWLIVLTEGHVQLAGLAGGEGIGFVRRRQAASATWC